MRKQFDRVCALFLLSLLLLFSGCGAAENSIAWHIGVSSSSQIETVQIYEGYSAADIVDGVMRAKSADITDTAEGKRFVQSLFFDAAEEIPEPEAALPGASVKGALVFTLKPDSKAVYQKITVRVIEKEEEIVTLQTELSYSEAERLRRMEEEDYSTAEERWFLFSDTASLYDPAFMEILLKENLK